MSLRQKIKRLFSFAKKEDDEQIVESLLEMQYAVLYPADMLSPLGMAIAFYMRKPVIVGTDKVKLYSLYSKTDGSFVGSAYVVKYQGRYYGSLIGANYIFSCRSGAFRFKKTDKMLVPLKKEEKTAYVLNCVCECSKNEIKVLSLDKISFPEQEKIETVLEFSPPVSPEEAFIFKQVSAYM